MGNAIDSPVELRNYINVMAKWSHLTLWDTNDRSHSTSWDIMWKI